MAIPQSVFSDDLILQAVTGFMSLRILGQFGHDQRELLSCLKRALRWAWVWNVRFGVNSHSIQRLFTLIGLVGWSVGVAARVVCQTCKL